MAMSKLWGVGVLSYNFSKFIKTECPVFLVLQPAICRDLNPDPRKILATGFRSSSRKIFSIGQNYDIINSSELPYYYDIFYLSSIKNWFLVNWSDSWRHIAYLWYHFTKRGEWYHPKSELKGKNPSESEKIFMLHEIRLSILTQAENLNSKD